MGHWEQSDEEGNNFEWKDDEDNKDKGDGGDGGGDGNDGGDGGSGGGGNDGGFDSGDVSGDVGDVGGNPSVSGDGGGGGGDGGYDTSIFNDNRASQGLGGWGNPGGNNTPDSYSAYTPTSVAQWENNRTEIEAGRDRMNQSLRDAYQQAKQPQEQDIYGQQQIAVNRSLQAIDQARRATVQQQVASPDSRYETGITPDQSLYPTTVQGQMDREAAIQQQNQNLSQQMQAQRNTMPAYNMPRSNNIDLGDLGVLSDTNQGGVDRVVQTAASMVASDITGKPPEAYQQPVTPAVAPPPTITQPVIPSPVVPTGPQTTVQGTTVIPSEVTGAAPVTATTGAAGAAQAAIDAAKAQTTPAPNVPNPPLATPTGQRPAEAPAVPGPTPQTPSPSVSGAAGVQEPTKPETYPDTGEAAGNVLPKPGVVQRALAQPASVALRVTPADVVPQQLVQPEQPGTQDDVTTAARTAAVQTSEAPAATQQQLEIVANDVLQTQLPDEQKDAALQYTLMMNAQGGNTPLIPQTGVRLRDLTGTFTNEFTQKLAARPYTTELASQMNGVLDVLKESARMSGADPKFQDAKLESISIQQDIDTGMTYGTNITSNIYSLAAQAENDSQTPEEAAQRFAYAVRSTLTSSFVRAGGIYVDRSTADENDAIVELIQKQNSDPYMQVADRQLVQTYLKNRDTLIGDATKILQTTKDPPQQLPPPQQGQPTGQAFDPIRQGLFAAGRLQRQIRAGADATGEAIGGALGAAGETAGNIVKNIPMFTPPTAYAADLEEGATVPRLADQTAAPATGEGVTALREDARSGLGTPTTGEGVAALRGDFSRAVSSVGYNPTLTSSPHYGPDPRQTNFLRFMDTGAAPTVLDAAVSMYRSERGDGITDASQLDPQEKVNVANAIADYARGDTRPNWVEPVLFNAARAAWYRETQGQQGSPEFTPSSYIESWVNGFLRGETNTPLTKELTEDIRRLGGTPPVDVASSYNGPWWLGKFSKDITVPQNAEAIAKEVATGDVQYTLSMCGPIAAQALLRGAGQDYSFNEVFNKARATDKWGMTSMGMAMRGPDQFAKLLTDNYGVDLTTGAPTDAFIQGQLAKGSPVVVDTPLHYFVISGQNPDGSYYVGSTGQVFTNGGRANMTLDQIGRVAGSPRVAFAVTNPLMNSRGEPVQVSTRTLPPTRPPQTMTEMALADERDRAEMATGTAGRTAGVTPQPQAAVPEPAAAASGEPTAILHSGSTTPEVRQWQQEVNSVAPQLPARIDASGGREDVLRQWMPLLEWNERATGTPAAYLAGIIIAESNGGQSRLATENNNWFSVQASQYDSQANGTVKYADNPYTFASYASPNKALARFIGLISNPENGNYRNAWRNRQNIDGFIDGLHSGGYATDADMAKGWRGTIHQGAALYERLKQQQYAGRSM